MARRTYDNIPYNADPSPDDRVISTDRDNGDSLQWSEVNDIAGGATTSSVFSVIGDADFPYTPNKNKKLITKGATVGQVVNLPSNPLVGDTLTVFNFGSRVDVGTAKIALEKFYKLELIKVADNYWVHNITRMPLFTPSLPYLIVCSNSNPSNFIVATISQFLLDYTATYNPITLCNNTTPSSFITATISSFLLDYSADYNSVIFCSNTAPSTFISAT